MQSPLGPHHPPDDLSFYSVGKVSRVKVLITADEAQHQGFAPVPQAVSAAAASQAAQAPSGDKVQPAGVRSGASTPFVHLTRREQLLRVDHRGVSRECVKVPPPPLHILPPEPAQLSFRHK